MGRLDDFRSGYYQIIADELYDLATRGYLAWTVRADHAESLWAAGKMMEAWVQQNKELADLPCDLIDFGWQTTYVLHLAESGHVTALSSFALLFPAPASIPEVMRPKTQ